jgi:hypothetical protein
VHDRELMTAFEDCSLPPASFRHRDHVHLAWLYLRDYPLLEAVARYSSSLRRYATSLGAASKYHETITLALLFLISERMSREPAAAFDAFAERNPDLFGPILDRYYSREVLDSDLARSTFVLPRAHDGQERCSELPPRRTSTNTPR